MATVAEGCFAGGVGAEDTLALEPQEPRECSKTPKKNLTRQQSSHSIGYEK